MHNIPSLAREALEILQTIEQIKGPVHARMVLSVFSLNNNYSMSLLHSSISEEGVKVMIESWESLIGQLIFCYTDATLKQDPKWEEYSPEEKDDKALRFMNSLQEDIETLDRKQKEYAS